VPLSVPPQADSFEAYEAKVTKLSAGDQIMFTKNIPTANVRIGDIRKIKEITGSLMTLDTGKQIPTKEGAHIRSGYSQTGYISQGDQADYAPIYAPASVSGMINQRSWHTAISRARQRMRIFTNSVELIEQRAPMPEDRGSALNGKASENDKVSATAKDLDLQPGKRIRKFSFQTKDLAMETALKMGMENAIRELARTRQQKQWMER
jgi:ATP-dependent exoDNAse (exonuclease V) alpha subunit